MPIIGAVSQTYVPAVGDLGEFITVGVEGVNSIGAGAEAISAAVGPISTTPAPPPSGFTRNRKWRNHFYGKRY